ncbi:hypothetical protein T4D_10529 [Trichinella pseudospiralis]|uniref:Uncharacterized protein n=1 Tax=Trichinella pseudospiralis TaxID=6337 RepID=A0A0V1FB72_TRIPS|nr:hypothetical protein T4D_10529 [Trichinella pseudospiralis]
MRQQEEQAILQSRACLHKTETEKSNKGAWTSDRPSWNGARLYHGDITEFLELEYQRSTVGGSRGRVPLSFAYLIPDRIKRFPKERL